MYLLDLPLAIFQC